MNSISAHTKERRHLRLSVCRTPPPRPFHIHPRDQSTRRIKLLPRRKCRSTHPFALEKRGCDPLRDDLRAPSSQILYMCYYYLAEQQMLYEFEIGLRLLLPAKQLFWKQKAKRRRRWRLNLITNAQTKPTHIVNKSLKLFQFWTTGGNYRIQYSIMVVLYEVDLWSIHAVKRRFCRFCFI